MPQNRDDNKQIIKIYLEESMHAKEFAQQELIHPYEYEKQKTLLIKE